LAVGSKKWAVLTPQICLNKYAIKQLNNHAMDRSFKDLIGFQKAYKLAMKIFELSKQFPIEEKYSLTDQMRRSSRSVCVNIAEAYRKRLYVKHYLSKLTDSDGEYSETIVWVNFAKDCHYITSETVSELEQEYEEVGRLIGNMINHPEKFGVKML
jgi:four helix bundle protein